MYKHVNMAMDVDGLITTEKAILLVICARANEGGTCFPSYEKMAKDASMGVSTAKRSTKSLIRKGLIRIIGKKSRANVYAVTIKQSQIETIGEDVKSQSEHVTSQIETDNVSNRDTNKPIIKNNKEAKVVELRAATPRTEKPHYELDPEKRRANHQRNMERAIACGLIKAK